MSRWVTPHGWKPLSNADEVLLYFGNLSGLIYRPTLTPSADERKPLTMAQPPPPAYDPIPLDRDLYQSVADTATQPGAREKVDSFTVPIRSGRAWEVKAGQVCRILTPEGPQVADFNVWNKHNPRERFWAARTRQLQQSHVKVFDRLWSCLPYLRPMITVTAVRVPW